MADFGAEARRRLGQNVRRARRYRGKSLDELAGLIGRSKSWLSKVENGLLPLDKRSDIARIAQVLDVSASDLEGEPTSTIPRVQRHGDIMRLRDVLLDTALSDPPDTRARSLGELSADWEGPILAARQAADHATLGRVLPEIVAELHVHVATGDEGERAQALRLLVDACTAATFLLKNNGQADLAWIAADRARQAAELLDDPVWTGAATFAQAHCRFSAAMTRALRGAERVADALEPHLRRDRLTHEVYGMLRLSSALARSVNGDHDAARTQADEAQRVAERVGEHADSWQWFGPNNVATWRTLLAVEAGEPREALHHAGRVRETGFVSKGRRSALHIEKARAHALLGQVRESVDELRMAERLSAPRLHNNPLARELVATQLERDRRAAGGRELRGLAYRMGVI
ncbi:helix-turn-helix domain-containing protein [Bailinhaonella thermotolerans]|uniref:helix-turn-helix domain-containing protein n=1 Tax=Bailinhaonella thermotolerans TaxID=1070861 RepID=UPI00192A4EDB|nr:helix-turn-helix transcriptional regulator [Bailinhaonella thermotolerans]